MRIEKKSACVKSGCESTKPEKEVKAEDEVEVKEDIKEEVESVEDINDFGEDASEEDIEAKKNLGISKQFYSLAAEHVKNAIDALGDAASSGDRYAKQEIADLSVILLDLDNLQRMA